MEFAKLVNFRFSCKKMFPWQECPSLIEVFCKWIRFLFGHISKNSTTYLRTGICLAFAYEYKFEFEKDSNIAKNKQQSMHSTVRRKHVTS